MRIFTLNRLVLSTALLFGVPAAAGAGGTVNPVDVMQHNFLASNISTFNGDVTITLVTSQGQERVRKLRMWSKLKDKSTESEVLIRFDQPGDIKGTGFLQIEKAAEDDDIWVFLPALGKTRRMVANAKRDSFFGTDFSYGDILLPAVSRYDHAYLRTEKLGDDSCDVIESKPKDGKTREESGYSRKVIWLDATSHVERKVEYYDLSGTLLKTQRAFDIQQIEPSRWIPLRREMVNHQTGHKTLYQLEHITRDRSNEDFFTARNLEHM